MTSIIDVRSWWPVICPQRTFVDRQGEANAYLETNPALWIEPDGTFILLVRLVNYRKFVGRAFKMGGANSVSLYHICRGTMDSSGNPVVTSAAALEFTHIFQKYPTVWFGFEDLRFLNSKQVLVTCPELNPTGNARLVLGELRDSTVILTNLLEPSRIEKNWMPFRVGGAEFVIYSVAPLAIKRTYLDDVTIVSSKGDAVLAGYHGSSNGVLLDSGAYLFLIHVFSERTAHRWLVFDPAARRYGVSAEFVFLSSSYIEFTCSLSVWNSACYVGLGVNDDKAFITRVDMPETEKFLYFAF